MTAASRSASSRTISGAFPPAQEDWFQVCAALCATIFPTLVEPVKFTRLTAGCAIKASTIVAASAGALVTTLTTPSGSPASRKASPISRWVAGQVSDAFKYDGVAAGQRHCDRAHAKMIGAFQGAMPSTTPRAGGTRRRNSPAYPKG